jgi:hypothetical protein
MAGWTFQGVRLLRGKVDPLRSTRPDADTPLLVEKGGPWLTDGCLFEWTD